VDALLRSIALVLQHRQLQASDAPGPPASLAALAGRAARAGVAAACSRGWPALAALLLPTVTADAM
jgi:hypothetical protein